MTLSTLRLKTEVEIFRGVRTPLVPLTSYAPAQVVSVALSEWKVTGSPKILPRLFTP